MALDLALADLFRPYLLRGETTVWHAALSTILVESYETFASPDGIVIRGVARFSGEIDPPTFDPTTGTLHTGASNVEGHPRSQPDRTEPWLDITDTKVEFALSVPRSAGAIIAAGVATIPGTDASFQPVGDVLDAYDGIPTDAPPSDYPGTAFTLDFVLSGIEFRPPFLNPAQLEPDGLLVPDTSRSDVVFYLPKIKLRLSQGSGNNAVLDVALVSLGASGLDDPGDLAAAELITMQPPYAFIGSNRVVGFGFRSAFLDLADGYTPPEILHQFGFDEAWTGLYLPEVRVFFAPNGAEDFAVSAGVENFLIGLGDSSGITGDFDIAVINQGSGELELSARFFDRDGRAIGIQRLTPTTAEVRLPEVTRMVVDVTGGRAPYQTTAGFDNSINSGQIHTINITGDAEKMIVLAASDTSSPAKNRSLTITARRREDQVILPPPGAVPALPATLQTTSITIDGQARTSPSLRLVGQSGTQIVVGLEFPDNNTQWQVDGASMSPGSTVTIDLAGGEARSIQATVVGDMITEIVGYFRYNRPEEFNLIAYSRNPQNTSAERAIDPTTSSGWTPPDRRFLPAYRDVLSRITASPVTIEGTASFEGDPAKAKYNYLLSQRRARGLDELISSDASLSGLSFSHEPPPIGASQNPPASWTNGWLTHGEPRNQWWKATISGFTVNLPDTIVTGDAMRPASPSPPPPSPPIRDTPPDVPEPPDWFRSARLKVRIVRDQFVAIELSGSVDFDTALESSLRERGLNDPDIPSIQGLGQNPSDGIIDYRLLYQTDPASQTDQVKVYIGADPNDRDGLALCGQLPGQAIQPPNLGRNILGMTTMFTPLLAEIAPANPATGGVEPLLLSAAAIALPVTLAELGLLNIERVVLFGGEAVYLRRGDLWEMSFLFDVETAVSADISLGGVRLLEIPREKPLAVRYKAIGLKFGRPPGSGGDFEFRPVFDQSKGYTIDVSGPGAINIPDPIGQIMQVLGARIARTNPLNLEIDLGFAIDLGVVSVDRARVRIPLSPPGPPELTAFGAGLKVPGVIEGSGYMEMNNSGGNFEIKGGIDVSLIPIKLRIAAQIAISQISEAKGGPATGVAISLEVELPVAIPLAQSGFGIYGFLGLFAMHYTRDEDDINSLTPALTWLKERAEGNPANLQAWKPNLGSWAFGVGATLGTIGSPIIFNVKGMVLLELPGPRLLLVVKANLLAILPELKEKDAEGQFLCVIDLDFGRGTLTIGLSIDFSIKPIVEINIPIEAFFNLNGGGDWHVYLGTFPGTDSLGRPMPGPVHANILGVFEGSGYVMISGHGIPAYRSLPAVTGVGLGVGLEVSMIWGNTAIRLYLKVTAGFNAVLSFEPFYVGGILYVRGELKLFIVSIAASAEITVQIGELDDGTKVSRLDGMVCGEVDLFFFSIEGCVEFHIGEENAITPPAPRLVKSTVLVSRSPALVQGTGVDRGIDSKIGDAIQSDTLPVDPPADDEETPRVPVVPIDAIPVISMAMPCVDDGLTIMGSAPMDSPGAPTDGFIKRGDFSYRYHVTSVVLERDDGAPHVMDGNTPSIWWTQNEPTDENVSVQLSLLNWTPNPSPKALERSEFLEETITERWGTICDEAAPPTSVLWTFSQEPLGPSETGWKVDGTAWPDPTDTKRSEDPNLEVHVFETWRTGDRDLDRQRGIMAAQIEGGKVPCPEDLRPLGRDPDNAPPDLGLTLDLRERLGGVSVADDLLVTRTDATLNPTARMRVNDLFAEASASQPLTASSRAMMPRLMGDTLLAERSVLAERAGTTTAIALERDEIERSSAPSFRKRMSAERERLTAATAGSFALRRNDKLTLDTISFSETFRRLDQGEAVLRSSLAASISDARTGNLAIAADDKVTAFDGFQFKCDGRLLASPIWDIGQAVVFGDVSQSDAIKKKLDNPGHKHGPLDNVIAIDSGAIVEGKILLYARRHLLNKESGTPKGLVIRFLGEDGSELGVRPVRFSDRLSVTNYPSRWIDKTGPWFDEVVRTIFFGQFLPSGHDELIVEFNAPSETVRLEIGIVQADLKTSAKLQNLGRPFHVGVMEFLSVAENQRSSHDQTQINRSRGAVESFLGPDSGNVALLFPGKAYKVTTTTEVMSRKNGEAPQNAATQTQSFWFRTDAEAPKRLDPWVLCSLPAENEKHVFGHEMLKIVFATNSVDQLYAAYGLELRARLKAASFKQVEEPGVPHPLPINPATLTNIKAHVLSPFEAVLEDVINVSGPCIAVDEERVRHSSLNIPIPLDPYTDYILDIEAVAIGAPADTVGQLVYRRSFSTGAFSSVDAFVETFQGTATQHRAIEPGVLQAIGNDPRFASRDPQGPEFDEALINAGLEPMEVPKHPRTVIFWEQANPVSEPRPAAVLVDASEPMLRERPLPEEITSDDAQSAKRWVLNQKRWLELGEAAGGDDIVDKIVWAPGRQRVLVTLKPNSRNKVLQLEVIRKAFTEPYLDGDSATDQQYPIVHETLIRAPWEEN